MNEIKKVKKLISDGNYDELGDLIDEYIDEVKSALHSDKPEKLEFDKIFEFSMKCGKIATTLSEQACDDSEKCIYDSGYFAALVEELELLVDKVSRIKECEMAFKRVSGKKHYEDIVRLLYTRDLVQSKYISNELKILPNQLTRIMKEMLDERLIVSYEYSKYKYYGLTWHFRKYLDSIGFRKYNFLDARNRMRSIEEATDKYENYWEININTATGAIKYSSGDKWKGINNPGKVIISENKKNEISSVRKKPYIAYKAMSEYSYDNVNDTDYCYRNNSVFLGFSEFNMDDNSRYITEPIVLYSPKEEYV